MALSEDYDTPGLSASWNIIDSGILKTESNGGNNVTTKKCSISKGEKKKDLRRRSKSQVVTTDQSRSTFYFPVLTSEFSSSDSDYEPYSNSVTFNYIDDSDFFPRTNSSRLHSHDHNDALDESLDSLYNKKYQPTYQSLTPSYRRRKISSNNYDCELLLKANNLDAAYFGSSNLRELPQRHDYSLPLDLDYDVLESHSEAPHMYSDHHKGANHSRSFFNNSLFSRLRRGSGSLNDVSTDESSKNRAYNMFNIGGEFDILEQGEKVKTKLISVWNNMKYGWMIKTKTSFKYDSQLYLLGRLYHIKREEEELDYAYTRNPLKLTAMEQFKRDFTSRIWFTYRRYMPPLPLSTLTTDCGWGCMLRCGQMIIAQGLIDHFLGRDWRVYDYQIKGEIAFHHQIISWFGDYHSDHCPFSIHSLVLCGEFTGKKPGDWYGPSSVAHILKYALMKGCGDQTILKNISIYVAQDCTVYLADIMNLATQDLTSSCSFSSTNGAGVFESDTDWKRGVIILIPVRLGGETLNPVYIPCIKALLAQDNCIGIIGGKPRHSMYFIGWQEDKLIYLDPHYCQDVVDVKTRNFRFESYHCMSPRKIAISKIDPSCTIGFYCRSQMELQHFIDHTHEMMTGPTMRGMYPMFVISDGTSESVPTENLQSPIDILNRQYQHSIQTSHCSTIEGEEFVFL